MLQVVFKKADGGTTTLGPLRILRFDAEELREVERGPLLAKHEGRSWTLRGEAFLRLDCDGPLVVRFLDDSGASSQPFGPFNHFSSVDGIAYADHQVFCALTDGKRWHLRKDHSEWRTLIVENA